MTGFGAGAASITLIVCLNTTSALAGQSSEAHRLSALHPARLAHLPGYAAGWKRMLAEPPIGREDAWIREAAGPGGIEAATIADEKDVAIGNICRPHDCHDYNFVFVIDPMTKSMFGLKRTRGDAPKEEKFYGKPSDAMRSYLTSEMRKSFPDP